MEQPHVESTGDSLPFTFYSDLHESLRYAPLKPAQADERSAETLKARLSL